jgi:hypothetical protein
MRFAAIRVTDIGQRSRRIGGVAHWPARNPGSLAYIQRDIHRPSPLGHDAQQGQMRSAMPMLFWLPLIFMNALFEMAVAPTKSAPKPTFHHD